MTEQRFTVTTAHKHYSPLNGTFEFVCRQDSHDKTWYANAPGFGCSKNYATAEIAIRAMVNDHAATIVSIIPKA